MKGAMIAATMLLLAGCAQTMVTAPAPDLRASVDAGNAAWAAAANRGDAAAVAALYTENATMLPPGTGIQHGRAEIEKTIGGMGRSGVKNISLQTLDVARLGPDAGREIGQFSLDVPGPRKKSHRVDGKYVVVWKLVGAKWLLDVDIWNMNK